MLQEGGCLLSDWKGRIRNAQRGMMRRIYCPDVSIIGPYNIHRNYHINLKQEVYLANEKQLQTRNQNSVSDNELAP